MRNIPFLARIALLTSLAGVVMGLGGRDPASEQALSLLARASLGADIAYDDIQFEPGRIRIGDLHAAAHSGLWKAEVESIDLNFFSAEDDVRQPFSVRVNAPHLVVRNDRRLATAHIAALLRRVADWNPMQVDVRAGTLDLSESSARKTLHFKGVNGTFSALPNGATYQATLSVRDGAHVVALAGRGALDASGNAVVTWEAPALPLRVLATLAESNALDARGGSLDHFAATYKRAPGANGVQLRGTLRAGAIALSGSSARLEGLRGEIRCENGVLDLGALSGEIGGAQLHASGRASTGNLALLRRLLAAVARQPALAEVEIEAVANGVAFAKYRATTVDGPLAVHMLMVDPRESSVKLDTVLAQDHLVSHGERTSTMAARTGAVGGVNGDYYDIGRTYEPQGMLVRSGTLVRMPSERVVLSVHRDKQVTFDRYGFHGSVRNGKARFAITMFNVWPAQRVGLMTPSYGYLPPAEGVTFARLISLGAHRYRVSDVSAAGARSAPSLGLAFGPLAHRLIPRKGATLEIDYDTSPSVHDVVAAIGGGPLLVHRNRWYEDPHAPAPAERDVRWPVVGVGRTRDQNLLFVEVDGRHPEISIGMTRPEFAQLMQRQGVVEAMALDSGGSATLVSQTQASVAVRNHPSDSGGERFVANGLFVYSTR